MYINKEWLQDEFNKHEEMNLHSDMENELSFYSLISSGDVKTLKKSLSENDFADIKGAGRLSDNPLQNIRYHFTITTAMITRYCVHAGMEQEKAYSLSDFYIMKMDKCPDISSISTLHDDMCMDFCQKMNMLKKEKIYSKNVTLCVNYIYSHIHERITVTDLAIELDLSESYLSKLFSKEMGEPISQYILNLKIDKAKNLLRYSKYSIAEIASYLSFSSQSHFIQVFQRLVGTTPHKYRVGNFRTNWDGIQD